MRNWAKNEVEIACKLENPNRKEGEWDYGCACYESALKAYNSLLDDGHSGMSWGITKNILIRLMNSQPLTPIEDIPEVWNEVDENHYQCKRMSSLFKDVDKNGDVSYHWLDQSVCYDVGDCFGYHNGFVKNVVNEMFPELMEIKMPFVPAEKPFKIYTDTFLSDEKEGDFDHKAILYMITPEGERKEIDRYFDLRGIGSKEISKDEFYSRKDKVAKKQERCEGDEQAN